jgi:hypothetical protein
MAMSLRTWVVVIAVLCTVAAAAMAGGGAIHARSEHSRPAVRVVDKSVIVTDKGKLFHRKGCPYIHGDPRTVSASEAEAEGFSPCTRCFRDAMVEQ